MYICTYVSKIMMMMMIRMYNNNTKHAKLNNLGMHVQYITVYRESSAEEKFELPSLP